MASQIELAPEVLDDFERFVAHMRQFDIADSTARIMEIVQAIDILSHSPLLGRQVGHGLRELVIGRASRGYIALYRYVEAIDTVFVLAMRSQRERDFLR